jgi:hypothetical protein
MDNKKLQEFWKIYSQYLLSQKQPSPKFNLRPTLSSLLAQIEEHDRRTQVTHRVKGNTILAWQVLRDQEFYVNGELAITLYQGELLGWEQQWDRDVFLTRIPYRETVSGFILNPGRTCSGEDNYIFNDERGLYLPIFDAKVLFTIINNETSKVKPRVIKYLSEF